MSGRGQISICEWIFGGRPLDRIAELISRAGCDAIELTGELEREERSRLVEALGGLDVSGITSVAVWPTRDLTHAERSARRGAIAYLEQCVDLAAEVGAPVVGLVPTAVGRTEALTSYRQEWLFAVEGIRELAFYAGERSVRIAIEAVNRYETCLVNRVEQALALAEESGVEQVGVIADVFHMQIEEIDPVAAVAAAGSRLLALHLADSTRRGLGHGSLDVGPAIESARATGYAGPLVLEFTAPGPGPFQADKGGEAMALLDSYVVESASIARTLDRLAGALTR
jgi:D-psicose/D-tagatose/L-ribulose 3-epimerase